LIHHARQDRKRVPATRHVCRTCGAGFWGTKRAVYCSHKCNALFDIRRRRYLARAVGGNLPIDSEGL
jgi:predicted nucleic acid-binding Zn ribbon protein